MHVRIFSRRWGHDDTYEINKTKTGWYVKSGAEGGADCDKRGKPHLFKCLDHDSINYPEELGGYLEWLWERAEEKHLSPEEIQEQLDLLAEWISTVERSSPQGIWNWPKYK